MKLIFSFFLTFISLNVFSQIRCGFEDIKFMGFNEKTILEPETNRDLIYTIPVIFHVVHLGEDVGVGTNISDEQILDGLRILNEDFRKVPGSWGDGNGVDVQIEFCLAQRDPNGNPTSGINRIDGNQWSTYPSQGIQVNPFNVGEPEMNIKSVTSWDRSSYMNVWIVSEIHNSTVNIQGYATLPTNSVLDGIVILHNVIGSFGNVQEIHDMSRTLTHEAGHYLGLYHTFGTYQSCDDALSETDCVNNGDYICDTPPTTPNLQCDAWCPGAQVENYMDYSQQFCKNMFSQGQKDRMRGSNGVLHPHRVTLLQSEACVPIEGVNLRLTYPHVVNECGQQPFKPVVEVVNSGSVPVYEFQIRCSIENSPYEVVKDCVLTNSLLPTQSIFMDFDYSSVGYGNQVLTFEILTQDIYMVDNIIQYQFEHEPSQELTLIVNTDFFGNETEWELINVDTEEVVWFRYGYETGLEEPSIDITCMSNGCYNFIITDNFGDGMAFGGDFTLLNGFGETLAYSENNWGSELVFPFCIDVTNSENCEDLNLNGICDFDEDEVTPVIDQDTSDFKKISEILIYDISGRLINLSFEDAKGVYIILTKFEDGTFESRKLLRMN